MDFQAIFTKTPRGVSEVKNRAARLPRNLLSVLATIDGKSTLERLLRESKLSEMKFQQAIERLLEEGFIKACAAGEVDTNATQGMRPRRLPRPVAAGDLDQLDFSAIARSALEEKGEGASGRASEIRSPRVTPTGPESEVAVARAAAEAEALRVAEEALKAQAAAEAKARADEEARVRAEAQARAEVELRTRVAAEAEARSKAEARARLEAHMKAEAERRARTDAEHRAEQERQAREALEARLEDEKIARVEAERRAREEADRKARSETEARLAEELRNREEVERRAREELERKARDELEARLAEERRAREAIEQKAREEAEQKAREEMEARLSEERRVREELAAQLAAEQKAKEDAEQRAREAIERKAQEEAERRAREEAERIAHEASERLAREAFESQLAAERRAREEAERRAEEEHVLRQREEAQRRTQEAAERQAREEAQRRATEEAERRAREDAEHRAREDAERRMREELEANLAAERKAREEAERRAEEEAEARARQEREAAERRRAREEAEREAREEAARAVQEEAARREMEALEERARADARRAAAEETEAAAHAPEEAGQPVDTAVESEALVPPAEPAGSEGAAEAGWRDNIGHDAPAQSESCEHVEAEETLAETADHDSDSEPVRAVPAVESDAVGDASAAVVDASSPVLAADAAPLPQADVPPFFEIDLDALDARERELRAEEEEKLKLAAERHAQEMAAKDEAEREALANAARLAHEAEETSRQATEAAEQAAREEERRHLEEEERAAREEEQCRLAEEERARRETEERRLAEEERHRERVEAERRMRAQAEQREREEAAARAHAQAQRKADEKLRKKREKEEAKERKRAAAEEKARTRNAAAATSSPALPRRRVKWRKPAAVAVALLLAVAVALVHLLPWDSFAPGMEKVASSALGEPVTIGSVRAAVFPSPHFTLENVIAGTAQDARIATVRASPVLSSLFAERKLLSSLELDSVTADAGLLPRLRDWVAAGGGSLQVATIVLRNVKLEGSAIPLPPFGGEVVLNAAGGFAKAALRTEDGKFKVDLRQQTDGVETEFSGRGWRPPFGPVGIEFDEIAGNGWLRGKKLALSELTARLYGGTATGRATLAWNSPWTLTGDFSANRLDLGTALKALTGQFRATGQLTTHGHYSAQAESLDHLLTEPAVEAEFKVERGEIENLDLSRALQQAAASAPVRGGKTQFAELSGTLKVAGRNYQYRKLALSSGLLLANGTTDMVASGDLTGRLSVELAAKPNPIRALVAVSGKLSDPQLKATR